MADKSAGNTIQTIDVVAFMLETLGFSNDEAKLYQYLVSKGRLTKLQLARQTGIHRSKVYRMVEKLKKQGLVEEVVDAHTTYVTVADIQVLKNLYDNYIARADLLSQVFPQVEMQILGARELSDQTTNVRFFRGKEGIRQMAWNVLRTKGELLGYSPRPYADILGEKLYRAWSKEFVLLGKPFREIVNGSFSKHLQNYAGNGQEAFAPSELRVIPAETLKISYQLDIYNDVTSMYQWYKGEVFGIEVHNADIADFQRQQFEIVWQLAKPMAITF